MVGRAITTQKAMRKEAINKCKKTYTKNEANKLRATTFGIAKLKYLYLNRKQYWKNYKCYIVPKNIKFFRCTNNIFVHYILIFCIIWLTSRTKIHTHPLS